jgi:hypothetical protein
MHRRGTLNPLRRLDGNTAQIAAAVLNAAGAKKAGGGVFGAEDFSRWGTPEAEEENATIEDVMTMLTRARVK